MTRILTGSDLPAPLAACWRAIARHVSETGKFPSGGTIAAACACSVPHATDMRRKLVERGYLARDNGISAAARWTVLVWPSRVRPRESDGRVEAGRSMKSLPPSKDDIERMLRLKIEHRFSIAEIARETGYSVSRVEIALGHRAERTKPKPSRPTKLRDCLMCGSEFLSEGPGHRVCQACKSTSRWRGGNDLSFAGPQQGRAM